MTKPDRCGQCLYWKERANGVGSCEHIGASREEVYWFDYKTYENESIHRNNKPPKWCPLLSEQTCLNI